MNYYLLIYIAVLIIYSYFCKQILIIINIMIISNISNHNISSLDIHIYNNVYTDGCFSTRNIYTKPLTPKVFDCIENHLSMVLLFKSNIMYRNQSQSLTRLTNSSPNITVSPKKNWTLSLTTTLNIVWVMN